MLNIGIVISLYSQATEWHFKSFPDNLTYGGSISQQSDNHFIFESHTNPLCSQKIVRCTKALLSYKKYEKPVTGRKVSYRFDFKITQFDFDNSPDWWVLFQDWVRIDPRNRKGNRPITTLEVKSYGRKLLLRHKDSSYQWKNGSKRTKQVNNGEIEIKVNQTYSIDIEITEGTTHETGRVVLKVDNRTISNTQYQTKSATQWRENVQEVGIYHDKGFNLERSEQTKLKFEILNLQRKVS